MLVCPTVRWVTARLVTPTSAQVALFIRSLQESQSQSMTVTSLKTRLLSARWKTAKRIIPRFTLWVCFRTAAFTATTLIFTALSEWQRIWALKRCLFTALWTDVTFPPPRVKTLLLTFIRILQKSVLVKLQQSWADTMQWTEITVGNALLRHMMQ